MLRKILLLEFTWIKYTDSFNLSSFGCDCSTRNLNLFLITSTLSEFLLNNLILQNVLFPGNVNCTYPINYLFILKNASIFNKLLIIKWLDTIFVINIKYLVLSSMIFQNWKEKYSFI